MTLLSIIIVNYNGIAFLTDCLNSTKEFVECLYEVIVVDNASTDGSCEFLRMHFPNVRLIESEKNLGFAGGNNLGVKAAKGVLLLLLNNDTRLLSSTTPAISEFDKNKQLGVLGCRLSYGDGVLQPSIGFEHTPLRVILSWIGIGGLSGAPAIFKRADNNELHYRTAQDAAWVPGAFLMTRKDIWERLGGLDERYFMYIEDVDYCKRVRMAGYAVAYTPNVTVIHYEGGGKAWIGEKALADSMRSYIVFLDKFSNKYTALFTRAGLSAVLCGRVLVYSVASLFSQSPVYLEKRDGYCKAIRLLLGIRNDG